MVTGLDGVFADGVSALTTDRRDGDFAVGSEQRALERRRRSLVDLPWAWANQVHGAEVVLVTAQNVDEVCGSEADGLVTADPGVVLAVQTADCLPAILHSQEGIIGVAHAGWRGMLAGIVERTADAMRSLGATRIRLEAGPCIGPECYEFGEQDLALMTSQFGESVRATTAAGEPALDIRAALDEIIRRTGLVAGSISERCTSCDGEYLFSHRARGDRGRMSTVVWREIAQGVPGAEE